jgi:hypothetical protein
MKMEGRFLGVLLAPESKKVAKKKAPSADQPQEAAAPDAQPTPITQ